MEPVTLVSQIGQLLLSALAIGALGIAGVAMLMVLVSWGFLGVRMIQGVVASINQLLNELHGKQPTHMD